MPNVDSLNIQVSATAQKASNSLDGLIGKFQSLSTALQGIQVTEIKGFSDSMSGLATAMQGMKGVSADGFKNVAKGMEAIGKIKPSTVNSASDAIGRLGKSLNFVVGADLKGGAEQIKEVATAIKQLGFKSSTKAIDNIPKLATAMRQLMTELSKAPRVSQNLIDMTNALGNLARTGSSSGMAYTSLSKSMNLFSGSTKTAKKHSFSLAGAIGKVYATYWLLFRAVGKVKDAIDISSQLTEVQNVVNATFGNYRNLIEEFSNTSIVDFGMSELTAKKVSSRFQSMGTAMGFSQGKMADMSIELTKLTADMASFYNLEQEDVAEDLQSVFTGQTRPLRQYGLDLTEATLKEWALKNGMDANIKSMSQAEKTLLRYNYVLANTGAAEGDFKKTQMTWANQTRILSENFKALASVIGGTFINALKPMVVALNSAMGALISFAKTVSESLGKIFGWKYEDGSGGIANDYEDAADSAGDIADSTGTAANNIKKMKAGLRAFDELKTINLPDSGNSGGGSGGGSGGSSGSASGSGGQWTKVDSIFKDYESSLDGLYKLGEYIGTTLRDALNDIEWDEVYQGAKNFGAGLADFLNGLLLVPGLFETVGKTVAGLVNTAIDISLSFAENFEFEGFGQSIADGVRGFFEEFEADDFANSINAWTQGLWDAFKTAISDKEMWEEAFKDIEEFFTNLDFETVEIIIGALTIKNIGKLILGFNIKQWAAEKITTALSGLTLSQIIINITGFTATFGNTPGFMEIATRIYDQIDDAIQQLLPNWAFNFLSNLGAGIVVGAAIGSWFPGAGQIAGAIIGGILGAMAGIEIDGKSIIKHIIDGLFNFDLTIEFTNTASKFFGDAKKAFEEKNWGEVGKNILLGIVNGILGAFTLLVEPLADLFSFIWDGICDLFGINSPAEKMKPLGKNIFLGIVEGFKGAFSGITTAFTEFFENYVKPWFTVEKWISVFGSIKNALSAKWEEAKTWWNENKPSLNKVIPSFSDIKASLKEKWNSAKTWWNDNKPSLDKVSPTIENLKNKLKSAWTTAKEWWNKNVKLKIPKLNFHVEFKKPSGVIQKAVVKALSLDGWPSLRFFASGGFPEDGTFRASHGEIMGRFDNGQSVVANNKQITAGISDAVYRGNQENNSLLREELQLMRTQNDLLRALLEKETGISSRDIFNSVRQSAYEYNRRTGNSAFV